MIVRVHSDGVALEDIDTLTAFKVAAPEKLRVRLDEALGPAGGFDGEHAWISEAWLRKITADRPLEWGVGFEKMLAFARTKGWVDPSSGRVRAHVEWES